MAENNVDILLSVDLDAKETLRSMAELRVNTTELREEQNKLDRSTAEGCAEYERLNVQIKANNKTIQQYEKQIVNTMTQEKAQEADNGYAYRAADSGGGEGQRRDQERDQGKARQGIRVSRNIRNAESRDAEVSLLPCSY